MDLKAYALVDTRALIKYEYKGSILVFNLSIHMCERVTSEVSLFLSGFTIFLRRI